MKKESYFTPESIEQVSRSMIESARSSGLMRSGEIIIGNACLVVLDMQDYFLNEDSHAFIPSARAILPNILSLVGAIKSRSMPVIFTRHINTDSDAAQMAWWWKDIIRHNDKYAGIIKEFEYIPFLIEKTQYDAFHETGLDDFLKSRNIGTVIITGVMTNLCCETTARSAFVRGYRPLVPVDATAAYTRLLHQSSILNLAHGFSRPVLTREVINRLEAYENI